MDFIQSVAETEIKREFQSQLARPKKDWMKAVDAALATADSALPAHVRLGSVRRLIRSLRESDRLYAAAWHWLEPRRPRRSVENLQRMRVTFELEYLTADDFLVGVHEQALDMARRAPRLGRYIQSRIVEIDFIRRLRSGPEDAHRYTRTLQSLQRLMLRAACRVERNPVGAVRLARTAAEGSLAAVAATARAVLDHTHVATSGRINCNLMVPVAYPGGRVADLLGPLAVLPAYQAACALWETDSPSGCKKLFVAATETPGAAYSGFWIPDWRRKGKLFPGAPHAFDTGAAQTVVVDDLPDLEGHDTHLIERWKRYMRDTFAEHMFISFPVMESRHTRVREPVAVVNVNIACQEPWYRAYASEWLREATALTAPFVMMSFQSFGLAAMAGKRTAQGEYVASIAVVPELLTDLLDTVGGYLPTHDQSTTEEEEVE